MKCPNCKSSLFYYIEQIENFWEIESIDEQGSVNLTRLVDSLNPEGYLECDDCKWCSFVEEYLKIMGENNA